MPFSVGPDNEKGLSLAIAILLRDESYRRNIGMAARDTILDRLRRSYSGEDGEQYGDHTNNLEHLREDNARRSGLSNFPSFLPRSRAASSRQESDPPPESWTI
jgi:hypothetical protein